MSKLSFDYSRFDNIVDSEDEEEHHPNLDKSLNARVIRITRDRKEDEIDQEVQSLEEKGEYEKARKVESKRPLHVGNMCKVAEERTIINSSAGRRDRISKDGEEFSVDEYMVFKEENKKLLDAFTEADWEQSHEMLTQHGGILLDDLANNYYMLNALDAEMSGNSKLVYKLVRQGQIISQIHQLAKPMNRPPRDLVHRFFEKFQGDQAQEAFQQGVDSFLGHIKNRAIQKKKEQEEEDASNSVGADGAPGEQYEAVPLVEAMYQMTPEQRISPKGLDPVEVFESLPEELQACFKAGDVQMMEKVASEMDPEQFNHHFQRCIDSGLWTSG